MWKVLKEADSKLYVYRKNNFGKFTCKVYHAVLINEYDHKDQNSFDSSMFLSLGSDLNAPVKPGQWSAITIDSFDFDKYGNMKVINPNNLNETNYRT